MLSPAQKHQAQKSWRTRTYTTHRLRRLSIAATVAVVVLFIFSGAAQARLTKEVVPVRQAIQLRIDSDTSDYSGSVSIDLKVIQATTSFRLYAEEMQLAPPRLSGPDGEVKVTYESGKHGLLTITAEKELAVGDYRFDINFTNNFNTDAVGLYRVIEADNGYLFTQFEEDDAREAFPCFDEPEYKIPFQLTLTVPQAHLAIANTPIETEMFSDDWRTLTFAETKPLPTYLLAIATGCLETVDIPGLDFPARVVTVKGKSDLTGMAIKMTPPLLAALEEYFGRPYPYRKLDLIAVPEFWAGAMENAGAITFRETALIADESFASVATRRRMATIIAHELAHMWFGDLVTMVWWDDLWLNEAFASWLETKIVHQVFPEFNRPISAVRSTQRVMSSDARQSTSPIRQPTQDEENLLANIGIIYSKGEAVLGMFENWLGEAAFREGIRQYLNEHEWGNAAADDLWRALSNAADRDVDAPLSTFILQPGVPLVTIEPGSSGEVTVSQKRFANYGVEFPDAPLWQIPVTLKYSSAGRIQTHSFLLTEQSQTIRLPGESRPEWVMPNDNMAGYYRWTAPPEMLNQLALNAKETLTTAERVGFVSNMSGLLSAGLITAADFLEVISRFATDDDPEVIRGVINSLDRIHEVFVNDDNRSQLAAFIRHTLRPALDHCGLAKVDGEAEVVTLLRPALLGFLADEGNDPEVVKYAQQQAVAYLEDPAAVDPSMISTCLWLYAQNGDQALYDDFRTRFETAELPAERSRFLSTLGDFRDQDIVEQALLYALSGPLRGQERGNIPRSIAYQSETMADYVFEWLMANYDEIASAMPPPSRAYLAYYASGCSEARLAKGEAFFSQPAHSSPGLDNRMARISESVRDCIDLRAREEASLADFLEDFARTN